MVTIITPPYMNEEYDTIRSLQYFIITKVCDENCCENQTILSLIVAICEILETWLMEDARVIYRCPEFPRDCLDSSMRGCGCVVRQGGWFDRRCYPKSWVWHELVCWTDGRFLCHLWVSRIHLQQKKQTKWGGQDSNFKYPLCCPSIFCRKTST